MGTSATTGKAVRRQTFGILINAYFGRSTALAGKDHDGAGPGLATQNSTSEGHKGGPCSDRI